MRTGVFASCLVGALVGGCTASADQVRPPDNELYFPTGIVVSPDESVAFVTNANSELRYDSGAVTVLELETIDQTIAAWTDPARKLIPTGTCNDEPCCEQDPDHPETLVCDESLFIRDRAGVRIGNFATEIGIQDLGAGALRLMIPTRGDPSVAWVDWDGSKLSCNASTEANALCDDTHRLSYVQNDADLAGIPDEPFGVFADSAGEFAMVTHLASGAVTLIDSPKAGTVQVSDVLTGIFSADSSGQRGATSVAGRLPNASGDIVYVGSRSEDRIQTFTIGRPVNGKPPFLLPGSWFFLNAVGGNTGSSSDTRGMSFSVDGARMYLVNRKPPSLQLWDTSIGASGAPRNKALGATDICRQASTVAIGGSGGDERAYVTCFQDGQIYVVDPRGQVAVDDIVLVGRGPYAAAAARTRGRLLVTNFLEDTVAVVDIAPGSATHDRVVLRIGKVKAP